MAIIVLIQLCDWFYSLSRIQKSCKRKDQIWFNFCKDCDVHMFVVVEEIIEAVSSTVSGG